jgi:hypothetical protein
MVEMVELLSSAIAAHHMLHIITLRILSKKLIMLPFTIEEAALRAPRTTDS